MTLFIIFVVMLIKSLELDSSCNGILSVTCSWDYINIKNVILKCICSQALIWNGIIIKRRDYYVCRPMTTSHGS